MALIPRLRTLLAGAAALFRSRRQEEELDEEIRALPRIVYLGGHRARHGAGACRARRPAGAGKRGDAEGGGPIRGVGRTRPDAVAGRPIRPAPAAPIAGVRGTGHRDTRAGHRREHRHLQPREHGVLPSAAARESRSRAAAAGLVPRAGWASSNVRHAQPECRCPPARRSHVRIGGRAQRPERDACRTGVARARAGGLSNGRMGAHALGPARPRTRLLSPRKNAGGSTAASRSSAMASGSGGLAAPARR